MSSNFQDRLNAFEAEPPQGLWNRIADQLEETALHTTGARLAATEIAPPPTAWENIARRLHGAKLVPMKRRIPAMAWIGSAAAVLIAILFFTGVFDSKNITTPASFGDVVRNNRPPRQETEPSTPGSSTKTIIESGKEPETGLQKIKRKWLQADVPDRDVQEPESNRSSLAAASIENLIPDVAERSHTIAYTYPVDKYMVYSREDGNAVKLPRKLFDVIACPGEDVECKRNLKEVREKFAASAFTADFTGVLDILQNMGENQ